MKWAVDKNDKVVHISTALRGHACDAVCVACGVAVSARKGEKNEHHFSHVSGASECPINMESLLHRYGKQVIRAAMRLTGPDMVTPAKSMEFVFFDIGEEVRIEGMQPDLMGTTAFGRIAIEIAVTSFVDEEKRAVILGLEMPTLEVNLSRFHGDDFNPLEVRSYILDGLEGKAWIVPLMPQSQMSMEDAIKAEVEKIRPIEEHVRLYGSSIWIKKWPDGGIEVRSPYYNPAVVGALKVLRRQYGGRWVERYKTNRFPAYSALAVLGEIRRLPSSWD